MTSGVLHSGPGKLDTLLHPVFDSSLTTSGITGFYVLLMSYITRIYGDQYQY